MPSINSNVSGLDHELEDAVLSYLRGHPNAADTLDGIVSWWLPLQRYENAQARIESMLHELTHCGVLKLRRLPNGDALYSLRAARPPAPHD